MKHIIAHTSIEPDIPEQLYEDHIQGVAQRAESFARVFGAAEYGRLVALAHDLGKVHPNWQLYVQGKLPMQVYHADVGAAALAEKPSVGGLALIVAGHHGGLPSWTEFQERLKCYRRDERVQEAIKEAKHLGLWKDKQLEVPAPPILVEGHKDYWVVEFFLRMLFSALVDADFLDTEKYYSKPLPSIRSRHPELQEFSPLLDTYMQVLSSGARGEVNSVRAEVLKACREAAAQQQGLFQLTVPTGGGKTLAGLAFALRHADEHHLRRVIVAVPLTSIIDQTAKVYREIFNPLGDQAVLEHHSAIPADRDDKWTRLASENWDAPLVVTTTVQLFESLLNHRPSACRKLHNIAGSVIIIDEFQALPLHLWDPIISILNELVSHYGVTVVLSTATQPPAEGFDARWKLENIQEIVPDPRKHFRRLQRVKYEIVGRETPWSAEHLASEVANYHQALVVMNTKAQVRELTEHLRVSSKVHDSLLVLSTRLCGRHRLQVIEEVKRRLSEGLPCHLISTQVVEAGVDLDFPAGFRILGPLVGIVQTAGRINREGSLKRGGILHVIHYEDTRVPSQGGYRSAVDLTRNLLAERDPDWYDPEFYSRYFHLAMQAINEGPSRRIQQLRKDLNYPKVAELFRIIPEDTRPVIVRFGSDEEIAEVDKLIEHLAYGGGRVTLRRLQPYMVNLYPQEYERNKKLGRIQECKLGPGNRSGIDLWTGKYDPLMGLIEEDPTSEEHYL